jgi:predicted phosphodiesterase
MEKIVALFDTHIPYHIPLGPVFEFIYDFKPNTIILGGDMHDFEPASHWISNQSIELDGKSLLQCYKQLQKCLFEPLFRVIPNNTKVIYLMGNHEDWVRQTVNLNRNGQGYWEVERNLPRRVTLIPFNTSYTAGPNLVYIHGIYTNENHAKKTVGTFHNSVLYGHTHDRQEYTEVSPIDSKKLYKAASCGCLCQRNPNYLRNRPNRWVNGFSYTYLDNKTGFFNDYFVYIIEGRFYVNGRLYK